MSEREPIRNRLTQLLSIEHPILLAPMDLVSGGKLAAAVSHAGGSGLLGGGYGDDEWVEGEWGGQVMRASDAGSSPGA
jgi:nitronate monooxygenase